MRFTDALLLELGRSVGYSTAAVRISEERWRNIFAQRLADVVRGSRAADFGLAVMSGQGRTLSVRGPWDDSDEQQANREEHQNGDGDQVRPAKGALGCALGRKEKPLGGTRVFALHDNLLNAPTNSVRSEADPERRTRRLIRRLTS